MHSYDLEGRGRVVVALAAASVMLVWLLHAGLGAVDYEPQWWLSVPSFAGAYSLLYWLFDRYVWRFGLLRKLGLIQVPDLNGTWSAEIESSEGKDGPAQPFPIVMVQRWSKLIITVDTQYSRSRSITASLRTVDLPNPELCYLYINEPKANAPESMSMHRGTAVLEVKDNLLEGDYYTGRGRRTIGTIKITRV